MVDSGSTDNFIRPEIAKKLHLRIFKSNETVYMASSQLVSRTEGYCLIDISVEGKMYHNVRLTIMSDLCVPIILGQTFMRLHRSVEFKFGGENPTLQICGVTQMDIDPPALFSNLTEDCRPICTKSRGYSASDRLFIKNEARKLLKDGIIVKSNSPWRAQVLVTHNERHKKRMVIDYSSTVNKFTELDAFPLPKISNIIHSLSQYQVFSKMDMKSAYYQCPIRESDRKYTAFEADGELFEFNRLPFGLTNSVAVFQRILTDIIRRNDIKGAHVYIDDIVIGANNDEELRQRFESFTNIAKGLGLQLNNDKCDFNVRCLKYLGHQIENGTVKPDPERLAPLKNLPFPQCSKSLKRCLGLFSYYSAWIPNFSSQISPLLNVSSFPLAIDARRVFQKLKDEICSASLCAIKDDLPFRIETDASGSALAATLSQEGRPVAFFSRTLNRSERSQSTIEREAAAVVESIRKWQDLLIGRKFTIVTDQQAVSFIFNSKCHTRVKNDKLMRWRLELSNY